MTALRKWFAAVPWRAWIAVGGLVVALIVIFWPFADLIAQYDVGALTGRQRAIQLQTARDAARGRMIQVGAGLFAAPPDRRRAGPDLGAIFTSRVRSAFVHDLATRAPRLAGQANRLASSLSSGGGFSGIHTKGPAGQVIALSIRSALVAGLERICWVAAFTAAGGAVLTAVLLRTRYISSAPEASAGHDEAAHRAA